MSSPAPLVLITGVSGFIASWVAYAALNTGYRVRGTIRSLKNTERVESIQKLYAPHTIELVEADLTSDAGWAEAVEGVDFILHLASPFPLQEPKDPNDLIIPAVEGSLRVLRYASEAKHRPKRIVLTSSVVAVKEGHHKSDYYDNDWSVTDSTENPISSYSKSKTLAEKAAWDFLSKLPEEKKFEFCTINPSFVLGPLLSANDCSSASFVKQLILGEFTGIPDMQFDYVSVYDVARAHLLAMTNPEANGKRFIVSNGEMRFPEISSLFVQEFRSQGYRPTSMNVPSFVIGILSFFGDRQAQSVRPSIGLKNVVHADNAHNILKLPLQPNPRFFVDMAYAGIAAGYIPDKSPNKAISTNYKRPEFDLSMIPPASSISINR